MQTKNNLLLDKTIGLFECTIAVINSLISHLFFQIAVIISNFSQFFWEPDRSNKFRIYFFGKNLLPLKDLKIFLI